MGNSILVIDDEQDFLDSTRSQNSRTGSWSSYREMGRWIDRNIINEQLVLKKDSEQN